MSTGAAANDKEKETNMYKNTILGYKTEIETSKSILKSQHEENERLRKHIILLEFDVGTTKDMVEKKQREIIKKANIINDLEKQIVELNETLDKTRVERGSYQKECDKNELLLKKINSNRLELEKTNDLLIKANDEIQYLRVKTSDNTKIKEMLQKEHRATHEIATLKQNIQHLLRDRALLGKNLHNATADIRLLREKLMKADEDLKEHSSKAINKEYTQLLKIMELESSLHKTEDDFNETQNSLELSTTHRNMLQSHLSATLEECQQNIVILQASTAHFDQKLNQSRTREKELIREIMSLETGNQLLKKQVRYYREQLKSKSKANDSKVDCGSGLNTLRLKSSSSNALRPQSGFVSFPNSPIPKPDTAPGPDSPVANMCQKTKSMSVIIPPLQSGPATHRICNSAPSTTMQTTENRDSEFNNLDSLVNTMDPWNMSSPFMGLGSRTGTSTCTGSNTFIAEAHRSPGKRNLLHCYMKSVVDSINQYQPCNTIDMEEQAVRTSQRQFCIDLVSCELVADDLNEIISWLRLLNTLKYVSKIDLSFNSLTDETLTALAAYLISLDDSEYTYIYSTTEERRELMKNRNNNLLEIYFSNNFISKRIIVEFYNRIIHLLGRVDVVPLIEISEQKDLITIYGCCHLRDRKESKHESTALLDHHNMPNSKAVSEINQSLKKAAYSNSIPIMKIYFNQNNEKGNHADDPYYIINPEIQLSPVKYIRNKELNRDTFGTDDTDNNPNGEETIFPRDRLLKFDPLHPNEYQM